MECAPDCGSYYMRTLSLKGVRLHELVISIS